MTTFAIAVAWLFSLCLHEFSHSIVAYAGGDTTVKDKGYLTFNPFRYAHPTLSLLMPLVFLLMGGLGLPGGAVYIDRTRLRSRGWESLVSLAGPGSNLLLAVLLSTPFLAGFRPPEDGWFWPAYAFFAELQISAVVLNLLPVPGFDGFGALLPWLPREARQLSYRASSWGMWLVFGVFWYVKPAGEAFWKVVWTISSALGISPELAWEGYRAFKIW
jgi:Zn-dependent protease